MSDDLAGAGKVAEAAERGTRELRELVRNLLGPAFKEAGQYFADRVRSGEASGELEGSSPSARRCIS